jgi:hypothetical protein
VELQFKNLFMWMGWDYISELQPLMSLLFISQMVGLYEDRATVEWYWQGKPEELGEKPSQSHSVYHKSHTHQPGCEPRPTRWEAGD